MKKRKPVKTVSQEPIKFIPEDYKDMDPKAKSIYNRPLIFEGIKTTREQRFGLQERLNVIYPEGVDFKKVKVRDIVDKIKVTGKGEAYKYIYDCCISKVYNVILKNIKGEIEEIDVLKNPERFWNTEGQDYDITQAVTFFLGESNLDEAESKN